MSVKICKVHDLLSGVDKPSGTVILVDRLWPRGVAKADFTPDLWLTSVAPSTELRKWWGHNPDTFAQFGERYRAELANADTAQLIDAARAGDITLVYAAKDRTINHATVLRQWLEKQVGEALD